MLLGFPATEIGVTASARAGGGEGLQPHRSLSDHVYHSESEKSALASCLQSVNLSMAEGVNKTIRVLLFHSHANKKSNLQYSTRVLVVVWGRE